MQTFKKLLFLLSPHERLYAYLLFIMMITVALLDMLGVASILPFIAVLTNPSLIETNNILQTLFQALSRFGVDNKQDFLFFLGVLVFVLLIMSLTLKAILSYAQARFVFMREYSICNRLVKGYLYHPYSWFLSRNSADLGKTILSEVTQVIASGMNPLMELIAKGFITITLITLLFVVDTKLALTIGLLIGFAYLIIFYFVRKFLSQIGEQRLKNNELRFTTVGEAFGAIKEVKVRNLEEFYIENFSKSAKIYAKSYASSQTISHLPRFILEAIAFGGILLILLYMMNRTGNFNDSLPIISLYVFAGYRLIPALQQIYRSFAQLTFISPSINKLHSDIKNLKTFNKYRYQEPLAFNKSINLNHIHFNYPNTSKEALKDINLIIPVKSTVGLVGSTGCGKTTTIDIILGLLEATKGSLEVDGKIITKKNLIAWQQLIGYVPQNIYLSDDTIMSNIAFGVKVKDINQDMVKKASKIAKLHQFIVDELPKQYQTTVGERGIRLSGGQRQRIGIARALYHNPKVLILDEATSALDNKTEKAVMDSINNLRENMTIILIAHRLDTVKKCDKIFLFENGKLKNEGTFEELMNRDESFSKNANINHKND